LKSEDGKDFQRVLLESEGIEFLGENKVDLKKYLWKIDSIVNI
jgi:alkylated DNA nucleotide flippase Atl1